MKITSFLPVDRGVTAIIGGGGKTTLMHTLARELPGTVILTTTTKFMTPEDCPTLLCPSAEDIKNALFRDRVICVAAPFAGRKLTAPPIGCDTLAGLADYVLVEADGARFLPLKAHAAHEPVIPKNASRTVLTLGADGFGRPISEVCHRPELYASIAGVSEDTPVTPEIAARVVLRERYGDCIFVNKVETEEDARNAGAFAAYLSRDVIAGSLFKGVYETCR